MTPDMLKVFALLGLCVLCFSINRPRMDAVALLSMLGLVLTGTLTPAEALSGFSDPNVILIAAFFVLGEGLVRTGVAFRAGDWLVARAGRSETRLLVLLMLCVAGLGSVMSSTGVVSLFIPVALGIATRLGVAPGRLLMPVAFAGLMSGMLTLVGTPPNLVVNAELERSGIAGFAFFDFTPAGLMVLALGIVYMLWARHLLAPGGDAAGTGGRDRRRRLQDLADSYGVRDGSRRLRLSASSPLVGQSLGALDLRTRHGVNVIAIERAGQFGRTTLTLSTRRPLAAGDVLLVQFEPDAPDPEGFIDRMALHALPLDERYVAAASREIGLAELLVPPGSGAIGHTVLELRMRSQRGLNVMGLHRRGRTPKTGGLCTPLRTGDTLLIAGSWKSIRELHRQAHDFLVLTLPAELDEAAPASRRAPQAVFSLAVAIALMVAGVVPNVIAALIGCMLLGAFRCMDMDSAYRAIHWQSLLLIACMLPFASALQKTGAIDLVVSTLLQAAGGAPPRAVIAALFAFTAGVGLFISNTATAVLMAPVALGIAQQMGASPYPFAMTVALAASAAFMTPVSSPVNTLVVGPGGYRFIDFVRVGVPFTLMVMALCVIVLPWLFPFTSA